MGCACIGRNSGVKETAKARVEASEVGKGLPLLFYLKNNEKPLTSSDLHF